MIIHVVLALCCDIKLASCKKKKKKYITMGSLLPPEKET